MHTLARDLIETNDRFKDQFVAGSFRAFGARAPDGLASRPLVPETNAARPLGAVTIWHSHESPNIEMRTPSTPTRRDSFAI